MFTVFFSIEKYIKMQLKFSFQMDGILNLEIIASKLLKQFVKYGFPELFLNHLKGRRDRDRMV
jgi:hypothetical protein